MRPVNNDYQRNNEYTIPLEGVPYYRSCGTIYAHDGSGKKYAVSGLAYERYDDQNFQYVFTPEWSVIDALPGTVFQGIPGLDMSMRLDHYYRVNMTPYFISERTPSENREDLWELLDAVGLDYYDRFEWLLRSNMRCGIDNLTVERSVPARKIVFDADSVLPDDLQPDDCVMIDSFQSLASTNSQLRRILLRVLRSGAHIWDNSEGRALSDEECGILLKLLLVQESMEKDQAASAQRTGVERAKAENKYTGRKKIDIDKNLLIQVAGEFKAKKISEAEAMQRLNIASRSTFYRRLKDAE